MAHVEKPAPISIFNTENILAQYFQHRDIGKRFVPEEKQLLAQNIKEAWGISPERTETVPFYSFPKITRLAGYKDGDDQLLKRTDLRIGGQLDLITNLEKPEDIFRLRSFLSSVNNPETTLATMILPAERGDRPEKTKRENIEYEEVLDLRTHLQDLALYNVKRLIMSGTHSPALAYFALEAGIAIVDLIPHPAMFDFVVQQGLLQGKNIIPVTGDDGAGDMGELIEKLAAEQNIPSEKSVHAHKIKTDNKVEIIFDEVELDRVKGKTVFIPEDILSTGGTLDTTITKVIVAGAEDVIVLVTYPFFAGKALKRLGNRDKVTIITTDAKIPVKDIKSAKNVFTVPILEKFSSIMDLDRQGIDYWSEEGRQKLRSLGFCLNPWMAQT